MQISFLFAGCKQPQFKVLAAAGQERKKVCFQINQNQQKIKITFQHCGEYTADSIKDYRWSLWSPRDREGRLIAVRGSTELISSIECHPTTTTDRSLLRQRAFYSFHSPKVTFYGSAFLLFFVDAKSQVMLHKSSRDKTSHMTMYFI